MRKRLLTAILCLAALAALPGCASILDGQTLDITPHQKQSPATADRVIEASSYGELKARVLSLIQRREETGLIQIASYDGNIENDVKRVCAEMPVSDPLGAFAVFGITGTVNKVVSEVEIHIDYKNVTKKQIESIITVSTLRYLRSDLQDKLANYAPSLTIRTNSFPLSKEDADSLVRQIYYDNPMNIVMLPIPTVEFFPKSGQDRIIKFTFGYSRYEPSTLTAMAESLKNKIRHIAEAVTGNSDGAILLSLCKTMTEIAVYDTLGSGEYSDQNISATAYGALINGSANGEGYAMAYKALCDELRLDCTVVIGEKDGKRHAWNIVELDTYYYHVDVSMCDVNGIVTAFLKNDTDMRKNYKWDSSKYKSCYGPVTYASLTGGLSSPSGSPAASPAGSPGVSPSGSPGVSPSKASSSPSTKPSASPSGKTP